MEELAGRAFYQRVETLSSVDLGRGVKRGLAWSTVNNLVLRLSWVLVGVLLARLLSPQVFGIYAVGLTAQAILQTFAELGMSADLIRNGDIRRRAPTVATVGLVVSTSLAIVTCILAEPIAALFGDASGASVIRVLSITLVLGGISAVPYAVAQREFLQKKQFVVDAAGLVIATALTLALIAAGFGAMALAISRVASQTFTTIAQFVFTRVIPRFGFDVSIARSALSFGAPLAAANFLTFMLLSVDKMIVGHKGGAAILGIYVLAFNLSTWPVTVVGTAIRSVAFPAFAQLREDRNAFERGVVTATQLAWAASLPIGFSLAVLAEPFVNLVYGHKWSESAVPLVGLAVFGILRVIFDVMASALLAVGDSRRILAIQGLWIAILTPALWFGMERFGLGGASWAQVVVALGCIYPAYLWALAKRGIRATELLQASSWPLIASLPATAAAAFVSRLIETDVLAVLLGGLAGVLVYFLLLVRWIRERLAALRSVAPEPARTGHAELAASGRDSR